MMDEIVLKTFLKKFADNRHTEHEHKVFINWLNTADIEQVKKTFDLYQIIFEIQANKKDVQYPQLVVNIEKRLNELDCENVRPEYSFRLWQSFKSIASIAAILVLITILGIYFNFNRNLNKPVIVENRKEAPAIEIAPGRNKAILTLSNGSRINLDNAKNGLLVSQTGLNIRKSVAGQIIYEKSRFPLQNSRPAYNVVTTPRGGQYQIILPDGSKVWLNAASSLKFPTSFSNKERIVELRGEAYFEISKVMSSSFRGLKGSRIPFKVISGKQTLEVFGTHFNINAYPDELTINTTLLEGSVKISQNKTLHSTFLKPGQQAKVGANVQVSNVDVNEAIAWKNGYFIFSHENIQSIMRKISRWYDVEIEYEGKITKEGFVGSVSRFEKVSQVLEMLQLTGSVHFKIEDMSNKDELVERRIIVLP
ncbi:transmembrane sensor [Pedobacter sp. CG_S7]|uniref:FecR family protein n=1 Tax=Pedobacter sp. CG_S7 TaxID=3143930 RepID=UPI00339379EB